MYLSFFKPLMDKTAALIMILCLLPLLLVTATLIAITMGRPIVFAQKRPGKKGKIFTIYKFRTMTNERDSHGELLSDQARLRGIGKIIRSLSLDELPQLFNVLKGEMSFIGPRPLLVEYLPLYSSEQAKRHNLTPGITGWAQVNGRNAISWEKKFELDVYYVEHCSFLLDCKIMALTIYKIVKREGVNSTQSVTMEKFQGNGKNHK